MTQSESLAQGPGAIDQIKPRQSDSEESQLWFSYDIKNL